MLLKKPKQYEITVDVCADYVTTLTAFAFAALKMQPTTLERVERTELIAAMEGFLASGGVECRWVERSVTIDPSHKKPYDYHQPVADYELFKYMLTLAATVEGSRISLIGDIDNTIQMIVLALRRMGAELEFKGGKKPAMSVQRAVNRQIKYHLRRESAKIVPQVVLAMTAVNKSCELFDLFAEGRFDYLFAHFIKNFKREDLTQSSSDDELERRLRRRAPQISEYKSKITVEEGVKDVESTLTLRPDAEYAAYLAAGVISQSKGRLILKNFRGEDISGTPLAQLKRMGVEFVSTRHEGEENVTVAKSSLKGRNITYEQLHDFPDSVGALVLAGARSEGTSVIRSSPFNTRREETRRRRLCEIVKTFGVKIAEISDGFVLEGSSELSAERVMTGNDFVCALLAVAASLGTVDQLEVDDVSAAARRWGSAFTDLLSLFPTDK